MATLKEDGPFLNAAVLCERVIESTNHTISLSRILTWEYVTGIDTKATPRPSVTAQLQALVSLSAGAARGSYQVRLRLVKPSGRATLFAEGYTATFVEDSSVLNMIWRNLAIQTDEEGTHWVDVLVNGERLTRIPWSVIFQPTSSESASYQSSFPHEE